MHNNTIILGLKTCSRPKVEEYDGIKKVPLLPLAFGLKILAD